MGNKELATCVQGGLPVMGSLVVHIAPLGSKGPGVGSEINGKEDVACVWSVCFMAFAADLSTSSHP